MLANEWVDAVVFGPGDLAATMGLHGDWQHSEVVRAMERVIEIALARGIATEPAIYPRNHQEYQRQRRAGIQLLGRFPPQRIRPAPRRRGAGFFHVPRGCT